MPCEICYTSVSNIISKTMPYLENCSIENMIENNNEILNEENEIKRMLINICEGIEDFHNHGIIHQNLKPSNIFININDDNNNYILSDYNDHEIYNVMMEYGKKDLIYLSPEMKSLKEVNESSDLWSIGCIMYYVLSKSEVNTINPNYSLIKNEKYIEIIKKLLKKDKYKRMKINELKIELSNISMNEEMEYNKDLILLFIINKHLIIENDIIYNKLIKNEIMLRYIIHKFNVFSSKEYLFLLMNLYWKNNKYKLEIINEFNRLKDDDKNHTLYEISKGMKENNRLDYSDNNNELSISGSYILLQNLYRLDILELNLSSKY